MLPISTFVLSGSTVFFFGILLLCVLVIAYLYVTLYYANVSPCSLENSFHFPPQTVRGTLSMIAAHAIVETLVSINLQLENKFNSPNHQIRGETLGTPSYDHQLSDSCCSRAQYICAVIRQFCHQRDIGETYDLATEPSPAAISTHSSSTSTSSATPSVNMMR